jgi:hypothetical protein
MSWELVVIILVLFATAVAAERWRVPRIRAWAVRRGYEVWTPAGRELEDTVTSDALVGGPRTIYGIGVVLTHEWFGARERISEQRIHLLRGGNTWHTVAAIELDDSFDAEAVRAALPPMPSGTDIALDNHRLVLCRRGMLWPCRLDALAAQTERLREALLTAHRGGTVRPPA